MEKNSNFDSQERSTSGNAFQVESTDLIQASEFRNPPALVFEEEASEENNNETSIQLSVQSAQTFDSPIQNNIQQVEKEKEEEKPLEPPAMELLFAYHAPEPPDEEENNEESADSNNNLPQAPNDNPTQTKQFQLNNDQGGMSSEGQNSFPFSLNQSNDDTENSNGSDDVMSKMEGAFGQDFSNVSITQDSSQAESLGAKAFAQGNEIHFAPGEFNLSSTEGQELLGHELTHVVQQRQGRVRPTIQGKGFQINDDPSLESEADEMGRKAVRGEVLPFYASTNTTRPFVLQGKFQNSQVVQLRPEAPEGSTLARAREDAERLNTWLSAPNLIHFSTISQLFRHTTRKEEIKQAYHEITRRSIEYDLKNVYSPGGNPSLDLAEFWPYLFRNTNAGLYNDIATFLLPTGAAEEHLYTTLRRTGAGQESRERLVDDYNTIYGRSNSETSIILGRGDLLSDIRNDEGLSDIDKQKIAGLLHHKPTDAEKIFYHSGAISGTHNTEILSILNTTFAGGPNKISQLYTEWYNYVRSTRGWSSGLGPTYKIGTWTTQELNTCLREEFQVGFNFELDMDRDRRILNAFILGFDSIRAMHNQEDPQVHEIEEEQIRVSESILNEAVNDLGTNATVVYMQLRNIRSIYERRLSRARENGDPAFLTEHQGYWERKRGQLWRLVQGDMDDGFSESRQAHMILFGSIQEVPSEDSEMGIHQIENTGEAIINTELLSGSVNWDRVEQLVTNSYKSRQLNVETFNRDIDNEGPENFQMSLLRSGGDLNRNRIFILTRNGQSENARGALRLKFEFDQGTSETAIAGTISFLSGMNETLKQNILRVLAGSPDIENTGDQEEDYLQYITTHYPETAARYDLIDIIVPADSVLERLTRAESRIELEGIDEHIEGRSIRYGQGNEHLIAHHHLERLRELQRLTHATDGELDSVLESYGQTDLNSIAQEDYKIIVVQLREIHAQREQMKEYLITALEMGVETALTVLTAGAFGGALIACLGSKMAGILAREIAFDNYEALSITNLQDVALSIASLGTGRFTNDMIGSTFSQEVLESMTRSDRLMVELWRESQTAVLNQTIGTLVNQRIPSGEEVFQSAISILANAGGNTASLRYDQQGHIINANTLAEHVSQSMVSSMVSGGIENSINIITNSGSQSATQLVGNSVLGMGRSMLSGLNSGVSSFGEQVVESHHESRESAEVDRLFDLSQEQLRRRSAHLEGNLQGQLDAGSLSAHRRQQLQTLEGLAHIVSQHGAADQYYEARQILENDSSNAEDLASAQQLIEHIRSFAPTANEEEATNEHPESSTIPLQEPDLEEHDVPVDDETPRFSSNEEPEQNGRPPALGDAEVINLDLPENLNGALFQSSNLQERLSRSHNDRMFHETAETYPSHECALVKNIVTGELGVVHGEVGNVQAPPGYVSLAHSHPVSEDGRTSLYNQTPSVQDLRGALHNFQNLIEHEHHIRIETANGMDMMRIQVDQEGGFLVDVVDGEGIMERQRPFDSIEAYSEWMADNYPNHNPESLNNRDNLATDRDTNRDTIPDNLNDHLDNQVSLNQNLIPDSETTATLTQRPEGNIAARIVNAISNSPTNLGDIHFILDTAIADTRFLIAGDNNGTMLNFVDMGGNCGVYRDYSGFILESLPPDSGVVVRRMTTETAFGQEQIDYSHISADSDFDVNDFLNIPETQNSQHAFNVVSFPNGTHFILDPTFSQFISNDQSLEGTRARHFTPEERSLEFSGDQYLDSESHRPVIDRLLSVGYIPLTEENALLYSRIIGYTGDTASSEMMTNMISGDQDTSNPVDIEAYRNDLNRRLAETAEGSEERIRITSILNGLGATSTDL